MQRAEADGNLKTETVNLRTLNLSAICDSGTRYRQLEITNRKFTRAHSLESPAEPELYSHDAVGVADAEEGDVFTEGILKLDNLVL